MYIYIYYILYIYIFAYFVWPSVLDTAGPFFELPWTFRLI